MRKILLNNLFVYVFIKAEDLVREEFLDDEKTRSDQRLAGITLSFKDLHACGDQSR